MQVPNPITVCDRPGCGQRVTDRGFVGARLTTAGVEPSIQAPADPPAYGPASPPDLCRECVASLGIWWTARERRKGDDG